MGSRAATRSRSDIYGSVCNWTDDDHRTLLEDGGVAEMDDSVSKGIVVA